MSNSDAPGGDDAQSSDHHEKSAAGTVQEAIDRVDLPFAPAVDEEVFYSDVQSDRAVTLADKAALAARLESYDADVLEEQARYWVKKPYAYVSILRNVRDNEYLYLVVEPTLSTVERRLRDWLKDEIQLNLDYDEAELDPSAADQRNHIISVARRLLQSHGLRQGGGASRELDDQSAFDRVRGWLADLRVSWGASRATGETSTPTPENDISGTLGTLSDRQVDKLYYYLIRDFVYFDRIDPIKNDINVEDISCQGTDHRVTVEHSQFGDGELPTNVEFDEDSLDSFVRLLAQQAGEGLSKRNPSVDARLSDGSRAQLTLGGQISDHTNFTIRQFSDIPFSPVDLLNWNTFSLDQMVYLWLAIESGANMIVAGGTGSGKTTALNALSLYVPAGPKLVSIEDTRELELPHTNWVPHYTRETYSETSRGEYTEFDLLRDALRKNPRYVIMGEVRGEEGRDLFQAMSTGHSTYTTFHANSPEEVINRFTSDPINVDPAMFSSLDIVCVQSKVKIGGESVRRNHEIVEIQDDARSGGDGGTGPTATTVFEWNPGSDDFSRRSSSELMDRVRFNRGWTQAELEKEQTLRKIVLAYLVVNGVNSYAAVVAALQNYMRSPEDVLGLIAKGTLEDHLGNLVGMESVSVDVDDRKEALVPRPEPADRTEQEAREVLQQNRGLIERFADYDVDVGTVRDEEAPTVGEDVHPSSSGPTQPGSPRLGNGHSATGRPALDGGVDRSAGGDEAHLGVAEGSLTVSDGEIEHPEDSDASAFEGLFEESEPRDSADPDVDFFDDDPEPEEFSSLFEEHDETPSSQESDDGSAVSSAGDETSDEPHGSETDDGPMASGHGENPPDATDHDDHDVRSTPGQNSRSPPGVRSSKESADSPSTDADEQAPSDDTQRSSSGDDAGMTESDGVTIYTGDEKTTVDTAGSADQPDGDCLNSSSDSTDIERRGRKESHTPGEDADTDFLEDSLSVDWTDGDGHGHGNNTRQNGTGEFTQDEGGASSDSPDQDGDHGRREDGDSTHRRSEDTDGSDDEE